MTVDEIKERWETTRLLDHTDIETLLDNVVWGAGMIKTLTIENEWFKRGQMCGFCQERTPDEVFDPKCPECKGNGISYRYE